MLSSQLDQLGFDVVSLERGDGRQRVARFHCSRCPATLDVGVKSVVSPHFVATLAKRNHGWQSHPERKKNVFCPDCSRPRRPAQPPSIDQDAIMATVTSLKATAQAVTTLTSDQRVRVRGYLDKHFDDSDGVYLDAMSDQKIAEALNVPRLLIEQMREAAYGPIRISPEVMEARSDVAGLKAKIDVQQTELNAVRAKMTEIEARLTKLTT